MLKNKTVFWWRHALPGVLLSMAAVGTTSVHAAASCGGTSQPRCEVNAGIDAETTQASDATKASIDAKNAEAKGKLADIPDDQFKWSFIPEIPVAECENPMIDSPIGGNAVQMDVCSSFNTFKSFINGVLAFLCIIGCAQQIRSAMAVK